MKNSTGEKIQELRRRKKITQEQLADMLNISRQSVSKWELDNAYPETDKIIKMAEIFDVSIDYLLKDNYESNEQYKERNKVNTFNMMVMIVLSVITFGYIIGLILSYIIEKHYAPLIGFIVYIVFDFASFIIYIVFRNRFLTTTNLNSSDKVVVFNNTRLIYYFIIVSFFAILPIVLIRPGILIYGSVNAIGLLSFGSYLIFGTFFACFGILIAEGIECFHYKKVFNQNYEISFIYILIDTLFLLAILITEMTLIINGLIDFSDLKQAILAFLVLLFFTLFLPLYLFKSKKYSKAMFVKTIMLIPLSLIAYIFNLNASSFDFFFFNIFYASDIFAILFPLLVLIYAIISFIKPIIMSIKTRDGNVTLYYKNILIFLIITTIIEVLLWTQRADEMYFPVFFLFLVCIFTLVIFNIIIFNMLKHKKTTTKLN